MFTLLVGKKTHLATIIIEVKGNKNTGNAIENGGHILHVRGPYSFWFFRTLRRSMGRLYGVLYKGDYIVV